MRPALPATVTVTQARHPLEGRELRVLGWMRRLGRLELMLELVLCQNSLMGADLVFRTR